MARLAGILRPLVEGVREPEELIEGMGEEGEKLVMGILAELEKLDQRH